MKKVLVAFTLAVFCFTMLWYESGKSTKGIVESKEAVTEVKTEMTETHFEVAETHEKALVFNEREVFEVKADVIEIPEITPIPEKKKEPVVTETPKEKTEPSVTISVTEAPKEKTFYSMGRFKIERLGIDVGVTDDFTQANVDKDDLAVYYEYGGWSYCTYFEYIGDHNYQAFKNLPNVRVGDTAELYDKNGTYRKLVCIAVEKDIVSTTTDGFFKGDEELEDIYPECLFVSTCYPKHPKVMCAVFKDIE